MAEDDDLIVQLMLSEPTIADLTEEAVVRALQGFSIAPQRSMAWIARAIQGALYTSLIPASDRHDRQSNSQTRAELAKLSSRAAALWLELAERSPPADQAIWDYAYRRWDGEGGVSIDGMIIGEPTDYREFQQTLRHLDRLATVLGDAAREIEAQGPNWRRAEHREERVFRAQCLSPIYEAAFGLEPTVNSWPGTPSLGPWPEFFQRIVSLAFGEQATPDLEGVLDEARRRDKADRVIFAAGVVPEYHP